MRVRNYQELIAWQRAMDLVEEVYKASEAFLAKKLTDSEARLGMPRFQSLRTSRKGKAEERLRTSYAIYRFAYGSLQEVETQTLIADRLRYLAQGKCEEIMHLAGEVGRLLNGLMSSLTR